MPRIIYSLEFELQADGSAEAVQLIAPLDGAGQSPFIRPCPPRQRVIDLRVGDDLRYKGRRYQVRSVSAYRDGQVENLDEPPTDGYLVRGS